MARSPRHASAFHHEAALHVEHHGVRRDIRRQVRTTVVACELFRLLKQHPAMAPSLGVSSHCDTAKDRLRPSDVDPNNANGLAAIKQDLRMIVRCSSSG